MNHAELALAVSVRSWPDQLHRFLVDHGGARVRVTAMSPEDLTAESFDVLLIDDVCSFLSTGLVASVASRGASVLGVHDPEEYPDGRQRLLDCGVAGVIEAGAHPDEFLEMVSRVRQRAGDLAAPVPAVDAPRERGPLVAVAGASGGVGVTEITTAIARRVSAHIASVNLIDLDLSDSSLAQRLHLEPHPNLLTAIDAIERGDEMTAMQRHGAVLVLAGRPAEAHLGGMRSHQLLSFLDSVRSAGAPVVLDLGTGGASPPRLTGDLRSLANHVVLVAEGSPVGVARLIDSASGEPQAPHIFVNRAPSDSYRKGEIVDEIRRSLSPRSLAFTPYDRAVVAAAWAGQPVARGRFARAVNRWVDTFLVGNLG